MPRVGFTYTTQASKPAGRSASRPPGALACSDVTEIDELGEDGDNNVGPTPTDGETSQPSISPRESAASEHPEEASEHPEEDFASLTNAAAFKIESDARQRRVLSPDSPVRVCWDTAMLLLLLYVAAVVPITTFLNVEQSTLLLCFDLGVDVFFLTDLVLNFHTGYYDSSKVLILDKAKIRRRYLRSWFAFDLLSSLPLQAVALADRDALSNLGFVKMFRLLKIGRLSKVSRIKALQDVQNSGALPPSVVQLFKQLFFYFFTTHLVACGYWAVASAGYLPPCDPSPALEGRGTNWGENDNAWRVCDAMRDISWTQQYSLSYHTALVMMLGNDSLPRGAQERLYATLALLVGMLVNSVIIGSFASIVANMGRSAAEKQAHIDAINANLAFYKVPRKMSKRVVQYYDYLYACGHQANEEQLFGELPEKMRMTLSMMKQRPLIQSVDLFKHMHPACTVAAVEALAPVIMLPREYVMVQGQLGDEMFFVNRGVVQVTRFRNFIEEPIRQLGAGSQLGEVALVMPGARRTASACTLNFCDLQVLDRASFHKLWGNFPSFRQKMQAIVDAHRAADGKMDQSGRGFGLVRSTTGVTICGSAASAHAEKGRRRSSLTALALTGLERGGSLVRKTAAWPGVRHAHAFVRRAKSSGAVQPEPTCFSWTAQSAAEMVDGDKTDTEVLTELHRYVSTNRKAVATLGASPARPPHRHQADGERGERGGAKPKQSKQVQPPGFDAGVQMRYAPGLGVQRCVCGQFSAGPGHRTGHTSPLRGSRRSGERSGDASP